MMNIITQIFQLTSSDFDSFGFLSLKGNDSDTFANYFKSISFIVKKHNIFIIFLILSMLVDKYF